VFRPEGKISSCDFHNPDESVLRSSWVYDEGGRLVETQSGTNDGSPEKVLYSYDSAGRHVRTVHVNHNGGERESEACTYDIRGRKTKIRFLDPQPNAAYSCGVEGMEHAYGAPGATTMTVIHDERHQPVEVLFHDVNRIVVRQVIFKRDATNRLLSEEMHLGEQFLFPDVQKQLEASSPEDHAKAVAIFEKVFGGRQTFSTTTYEYDQHGQLVGRNTRMSVLSEERTTFRYNEHGDRIEETTSSSNREMEIDEAGNLRPTSETSYQQQSRIEYTYDRSGNWTERVVWGRIEPNPDFQRSNVERREITYQAL